MMNKLRISGVFFLFFNILLFSPGLYAQNTEPEEDVVYLKDGSILRGEVVEMNTDSIVKIRIMGGSVLVYDFDEVERIVREPVKSPLYEIQKPVSIKKEGHFIAFETGLLFGREPYGELASPGISIEMINGHIFNRWLRLGAGIGWDYIDRAFMPLFAQISGELRDKPFTPYYSVEMGYGFLLSEQVYDAAKSRGGILWGLSVGMKVHTRSDVALLFGLGFRQQRYFQRNLAWGGSLQETFITYNRTMFKFGLVF